MLQTGCQVVTQVVHASFFKDLRRGEVLLAQLRGLQPLWKPALGGSSNSKQSNKRCRIQLLKIAAHTDCGI